MSFIVEGVIPADGDQAGSLYRIQVGLEDGPPVAGGPAVLGLLDAHVGKSVTLPPTGPHVVLALDDPASVLHALYSLTRVSSVTGVDGDEPPEVIPPRVLGAVY